MPFGAPAGLESTPVICCPRHLAADMGDDHGQRHGGGQKGKARRKNRL